MTPDDFKVKSIGKPELPQVIRISKNKGDGVYDYVTDNDRILLDASLDYFNKCKNSDIEPLSIEKAGPREFIFFEPAQTTAAIVTCGGLCPGLNNVIRSLYNQLFYRYGVKRILGIQYGYEGFIPEYNHPIIELNPTIVDNIHLYGGSILGSSRGNQDVKKIVDRLEVLGINILFTIGGDGTLRGAHQIYEEISRRNLKIVVAGVPKTIDNDINLIDKSFGFETASAIANDIISNAHNEARGAYNGIALIKLMGRDSGFIAANAALSIQEVNFVLIPELDFDLYGPYGFLKALHRRLEKRHHALIVVAEGAGQKFFENQPQETDKSGNIKHKDIGLYLKDKICEYFDSIGFPYSMKYIDPSYIIRSAPANAIDSKFCSILAQNAVHAAMAGKTDFVVGHWNNEFTLLPTPLAIAKRKKIDLEGELWWNVLETTGQPINMKNDTEISQ